MRGPNHLTHVEEDRIEDETLDRLVSLELGNAGLAKTDTAKGREKNRTHEKEKTTRQNNAGKSRFHSAPT